MITTRTFTADADFDLGTLINLNHNSPNSNQLQINAASTPFPFINIAASARGTAIRIDVDSGAILGEYLTSPNGMGRDPSRTTVDKYGNVWVSNRAEAAAVNGVPKGSVARVGLIVGGTRVDANSVPNAAGAFLKPPFKYNTCVDRNGDGLIKTSRGLGDVLPWTNAANADLAGGVTTAEDECILNYTRVNGTNTRTVAVDGNNDVWVGGLGNRAHEKLSGVTGLPITGTQFNLGCGGYGGLVDSLGHLWSARSLLLFVPNATPPPAGNGQCLPGDLGISSYGLGRDPRNGHVWSSSNGGANTLYELASDGSILNGYGQPFPAQGVAVDSNGHVWMAEGIGSRVWHLAPDPSNPAKHVSVGIIGGFLGVTGVAVDANGKIWGAELNGSRVSRIDPSAGPVGGSGYKLGAIDFSVSLGAGANPYNYSDMTGFVSIGAPAATGIWDVIHDSAGVATQWGRVSWNASTPADTSIAVEVRAADSLAALTGAQFRAIAQGGSVCANGVQGRFLEIRTTLARGSTSTSSPILYDLTVNGCDSTGPVITGMPSASSCVLWPANHRLVQVAAISAVDPESGVASLDITVTSNEPDNGVGDGDQSPDAIVNGGLVQLRAERSGTGTGRVYTINAKALDRAGNQSTATGTCTVPKDMKQ